MLERESGPRREGSAIGLWPNAFRALDALGLAQPLREAHPLFDRCLLCEKESPAMAAPSHCASTSFSVTTSVTIASASHLSTPAWPQQKQVFSHSCHLRPVCGLSTFCSHRRALLVIVRDHETGLSQRLAVRRIELCREDGKVLRTIILDECEGAPHEFRGVYRGGLLRTLQSGVPFGCIQYNSAVQSIVQVEGGEPSGTCLWASPALHWPSWASLQGARSC